MGKFQSAPAQNAEDYADAMMTRNTVSLSGVNPYLRGLKGAYQGYDIPVLPTGILIGRDPVACQLIFENSPEVSRYHCRVTYSKRTGYFIVTDLNSKNGVFTEEGIRVEKGAKIVLVPGQIFKMCGDRIVFETVVKKEE